MILGYYCAEPSIVHTVSQNPMSETASMVFLRVHHGLLRVRGIRGSPEPCEHGFVLWVDFALQEGRYDPVSRNREIVDTVSFSVGFVVSLETHQKINISLLLEKAGFGFVYLLIGAMQFAWSAIPQLALKPQG